MTERLVRYQQAGDMHFLTFSCYHRLPYLASPKARNRFEDALERIRKKYSFVVAGYVVMPEQVHMLVNEPGGPVINPEESPSALRSCAPSIAASSR